MNLAVIALPELLPDDVEHIQSLRARHDPLHYQRIAPHVTLVFPTPDVDAKLLVAHVKSCVPAVAERRPRCSCPRCRRCSASPQRWRRSATTP